MKPRGKRKAGKKKRALWLVVQELNQEGHACSLVSVLAFISGFVFFHTEDHLIQNAYDKSVL